MFFVACSYTISAVFVSHCCICFLFCGSTDVLVPWNTGVERGFIHRHTYTPMQSLGFALIPHDKLHFYRNTSSRGSRTSRRNRGPRQAKRRKTKKMMAKRRKTGKEAKAKTRWVKTFLRDVLCQAEEILLRMIVYSSNRHKTDCTRLCISEAQNHFSYSHVSKKRLPVVMRARRMTVMMRSRRQIPLPNGSTKTSSTQAHLWGRAVPHLRVILFAQCP